MLTPEVANTLASAGPYGIAALLIVYLLFPRIVEGMRKPAEGDGLAAMHQKLDASNAKLDRLLDGQQEIRVDIAGKFGGRR